MKHIILFLSFFFSLAAFAQMEGISYQAVLIDNNPDEIPGVDVPTSSLPNQAITVQFTILNSGGDIEYQEIHNTETDTYGTINLMIGLGQSTGQSGGSFNQIYWDGTKNLRVDIDLDAGTNFTEFSYQELTYIPYVRHRELIADGATNLNDVLNVAGVSTFNDKVTIDANMTETNQSDIAAYPLHLKGSTHGMAIQLNNNLSGREHNFMSFWDNGGNPIGRIEGFQALTDVSQGFILDVLLANEPTEEEAQDQDDDDTAAPAPAPSAFDLYLNNDYSLNLLLEYMDLLQASVSFGINLGACIAGIGIAGDCDDVADAAFTIFVQGVQISLYVLYNESNQGVAFESGGADYAEWLKKYDENEAFAFGDVVGLKAGEISKNFTHADRFMVISKNPIVSGAMPKKSEEMRYKQVAFLGQVPVKVLGTVNKGDYILPSGNSDGMAIAVSPENMRTYDYKRIVGVAWDSYNGNDLFTYINTAVGINSNDMVNEILEMQLVMNKMQEALVAVNPNYRPSYFDTQNVSISKRENTTRSKTMEQLVLQKYGLDTMESPKEIMGKVQKIMNENDLKNTGFNFSKLPYLKEVLTNPTAGNVEKYNKHYAKVSERLQGILASIQK